MLAIVSNLSKEKTDVRLHLHLEKLGLPANVDARDAVSKEAVKIQNGDISVKLPSQNYRMIWIEADTGNK